MAQEAGKRVYPRQLRRLQVRFWRPQEERPRQGFTKNVSLTGAFVSTPDPASRGDRLRLELSDAGRVVLLYAVVVHSHRVPPELRRFADSAMGLRFLGLDEVVGPFLGGEALRPRLDRRAPEGAATAATDADPRELPTTGRPTLADGAAAARPDAASAARAPTAPSPPLTAPRPAPAGSGPRLLPNESLAASYVLAFASTDEFLATWRRDLANGGLFITTDRPARLDERVGVELRLPGPSGAVLRVEARVVQVVEPRPLASGRTVGGMGLELLEPEAVTRQLAPYVPAG